MKFILSLLSFVLLTASCGGEKQSENIDSNNTAVEVEPDQPVPTAINRSTADYQEFHENGQLKIEGNYDDNGERSGRWISYYENGIVWSESFYMEGKKDGHSVTFFPNGKVRYIGEYRADKKFGKWTFRDEEGAIIQEKEY